MSKSKKNLHLYDVVFLSHTNGLNHKRTTLTKAQADDPKKAIKAAFDENYQPDMGDSVLIKSVKPSDDHILCRLVFETRTGDAVEMAWLPKDYKSKDDDDIVAKVFDAEYEPDLGEFLTIEELPESDLNVDVVEW